MSQMQDPASRDYKRRHMHLLFEGSTGGEPGLDNLGGCLQPHVRPVQREVKRVRRPPAVHYGVPHSHLPVHNLWRQSSYLGGKELPFGEVHLNTAIFFANMEGTDSDLDKIFHIC